MKKIIKMVLCIVIIIIIIMIGLWMWRHSTPERIMNSYENQPDFCVKKILQEDKIGNEQIIAIYLTESNRVNYMLLEKSFYGYKLISCGGSSGAEPEKEYPEEEDRYRINFCVGGIDGEMSYIALVNILDNKVAKVKYGENELKEISFQTRQGKVRILYEYGKNNPDSDFVLYDYDNKVLDILWNE